MRVQLKKSGCRVRVAIAMALVIAAGAAGACAQVAPAGREDRWRQDLEFFASQFPAVQMDFKKLYAPAKFQEEVRNLERDLPQISDSEVILRLMRLVAAAKVAHTTVYEPKGSLAFHRYPLQFYWYADGAAVTAAAQEYTAALGARIVKIGAMTPEQLESAVAPYISHENQPWLHQVSPNFMLTQEAALHFGLAAADGSIELTLKKPDAEPFHLRVAPLAAGAKPTMISAIDAFHIPAPLYRKQPNSYYWYEYLPENRALFIQYNRCAEDPKKPFQDFVDELFRFADGQSDPPQIERVIVDLRFNQGGDSRVIQPLLEGLKAHPRLSSKGHIYALVGRATFSSGLLAAFNLRDNLHAILIGEPIGGKPNGYGEVKMLTLPNSQIEVQYCTKYFQLIKRSDPSALEPNLTVLRSTADFLNGRDPVLDAALKHALP
jgi:hypothetical protein